MSDRPTVRWLLAYLIAGTAFGLLDALWLGAVAAALYRDQLGHLLADSFAPGAAIAFYLIYLVGLTHFAIRPLDAASSMPTRLRDAALYGLVTYATWDLTSLAVFRDFPLLVVVIDLAWGVSVCLLVTWLTLLVLDRLSDAAGPGEDASGQ